MAKASASAGGSGAIRAGRAFVELFLQDNQFLRGLDQAKRKFEGWAAGLAKAGVRIGAVGTAISTPLVAAFGQVVSRGAAVYDLAERFGTAAETVSALAYAFERGGVGLDEFGGILDGLNAKIVAAADANGELIQGLRGLNGRALIGKDIDEQLDVIAEKFKTIQLAADQTEVANGLGLRALLPWLKKGKAGLDELRKAAKQAGAVMSMKEAKESKVVAEGFTRVWQEVKYTILAVGEAFLPASAGVTDFGERVAMLLRRAREWILANRGVIYSVAAVGAGLIALAAAAAILSTALSAVAMVVGLVAGVLKATLVIVLALLTPLGLVTAAVVAMGVQWLTSSANGRKAAAEMKEAWDETGATFERAWGGITSAIQRGDLQTAFRIAALTIKKTWNEMIASMGRAFAAFVKDNHERIVTLAFLLGAYKGAGIGSDIGGLIGTLGGAKGRLAGKFIGGGIGMALGGAAAGYGGHELSHLLQKLGNVEQYDNAAKDAAEELKKLIEEERRRAEEFARQQPGQAGPGWMDRRKMANLMPDALAEELRLKMGSALPNLFAAQKGIFSGPAQLQLGYGDNTAKRQLDAVMDIGKKAAALPEIDKKMGDLTKAMRFA